MQVITPGIDLWHSQGTGTQQESERDEHQHRWSRKNFIFGYSHESKNQKNESVFLKKKT
jgi:hypothetical protein